MIPTGRASQRYYPRLPDSMHQTGDIWTGLPGFGLFGSDDTIAGLVITPACDLSNHKTPTITYLPILPVATLLATDFGYSLVRPKISDILTGSAKRKDLAELFQRDKLPELGILDLLLEERLTLSPDELGRFRNGVEATRCIINGDPRAASKVRACYKPSDWKDFRQKVIKNSFSDDLHFLPREEPIFEWSAVRKLSVVAFRYPITVPRRVLDVASVEGDWASEKSALPVLFHNLLAHPPLKVTRLDHEFLVDLLTRFARLYIRIGASDFTVDAVDSMSEILDGECQQ